MLKISKEGLSLYEARDEKTESLPAVWRINESDSFEFEGFTFHASFSQKTSSFKISRKDEESVHFDSEAVPPELALRSKRAGDRMIPFGSKKAVKVKHLLENAKIPQELRDRIPLLCLPTGEIIWIPGLRRSNYAPIGPKTKRILSILWSKGVL